MAKKRLTRKQLLKEPDEFISLTGRLVEWARANTRPLIYGVSAVLGLVLIIAVYGLVKERQASNAEALLSQAMTKYEATLANQQEIEALAGVNADFDKLFAGYEGQPAGRLGRIIYGHYCLAAGAFDQAISHYELALAHFRSDLSLANVILNGLGSAYQQKGDHAKAITYYKEIVAGNNPMLKDAALFNLGRLHEQMGQTAEQLSVLKQLGDDFPNSFYTDLVREKIGG